MENGTRRSRAPRAKNYTRIEVEVLVAEVDKRREILFGPLKGPSLTQFHRDRAWDEVKMAVNSVAPTVRRVPDLKKKIKDLKNRVKTKAISIKKEASKMGGGTEVSLPLDPVEETMLTFIGKGIDIEEIAGGVDNFRATPSSAKDTWVKLRNCYMNAVKRRRNKKCQGGKTIPPWKYEQEMSFLQPYLQDRDNLRTPNQIEESSQGSEETTIKESASHDDDEEEEEEQDEESEKYEQSNGKNKEVFMEVEVSPAHYCTTSSETSNLATHESQGPPSHKKLTPAQEMLQIIKQTAEQRKIENQNKQLELQNNATKDFDESDLFYLSMSKTAKRLSALDQAQIRMELCRMISEAEIRQLETNSRVSPPPPSSLCSQPLLTVIKSEV